MKIEMKVNEINSKVLSKVKSQLSYPPLNLKRILEDTLEIWKKLSQWVVLVSPWISCNIFVLFILPSPKAVNTTGSKYVSINCII